ncbi:MAG: hypothetical protein KDK25_06890 [Leptospiraceae bacterium]|nr:hypothetical protein [Leptospiraceae bacterium]
MAVLCSHGVERQRDFRGYRLLIRDGTGHQSLASDFLSPESGLLPGHSGIEGVALALTGHATAMD